MNNVEQTLRLLKELERLDQESDGGKPPSSDAKVTAAALLEALTEGDFNLTKAILGVYNDA
jgi:hypothetical protein